MDGFYFLKKLFFAALFIMGSILVSCEQKEREDEDAYEMDPGEEMAPDAFETEVHSLEQLDSEQMMERFPDDQFEYPEKDMVVGGNPSLVMDDKEFEFGMDDEGMHVVGDTEESEEEEAEEGLELQTNEGLEDTTP